MNLFLTGAVVFGFLVAGLFFIRFWRKTHDRLFLFFAGAFWTLGGEQAVLAATGWANDPAYYYVYLMRLAAFLLIIAAIVDKNRSP